MGGIKMKLTKQYVQALREGKTITFSNREDYDYFMEWLENSTISEGVPFLWCSSHVPTAFDGYRPISGIGLDPGHNRLCVRISNNRAITYIRPTLPKCYEDALLKHQAIYFKSEEHYNEFMELLEELGYMWTSGEKPTEFNSYIDGFRGIKHIFGHLLATDAGDILYPNQVEQPYEEHPKEGTIEYYINAMVLEKPVYFSCRKHYNEFMGKLEELGFLWRAGELPTEYDGYVEEQGIIINEDNRLYLADAKEILYKPIVGEKQCSIKDMHIEDIIKELKRRNILEISLLEDSLVLYKDC